MSGAPSILTNMAFGDSPTWSQAVATICRGNESPDRLSVLRQVGRLLRRRARHDVVVTMGPRPSLAYGLCCGLLGLPSRQVMTEVFLDPPRPASPVWKLKTALFRWVSRRSLGILTNSSGEVELIARRFGLPESKLRFVPMYSTIGTPELQTKNDGTVVSIGRTLRDLDTLVEAARLIHAPVIVVAGTHDPMPGHLPDNLKVLRDIPLDQAHGLLSRAAVVVLPLLPACRSTGQVVLFEAMAMGKPVVASRCIGTEDYIRHGQNGCLVDPGDAQALAEAITAILGDPGLARRLGTQAVADCQSEWTPERHAERKLKAIGELWRGSSAGR